MSQVLHEDSFHVFEWSVRHLILQYFQRVSVLWWHHVIVRRDILASLYTREHLLSSYK